MPPRKDPSSGEDDEDLSFSDDRDDFREDVGVAPVAAAKAAQKKGGSREAPRKGGSFVDEFEPSAAALSLSAADVRTLLGSSSTSSSPSSSSAPSIWVPPALLPVEGVPRLDLPVQAPVNKKPKEKKKAGEQNDDDLFGRLSAGLDALEAAVDAAAAVRKSSFLSRPSSSPSSRHLVDALAEAGAIPASAKGKVKVLPSLPGFLEAERGVGLPATAADFERWLAEGEEAERRWVRENRSKAAGAADLGADGSALPRQAAREAARRWLRESHGASLAEAKAKAADDEGGDEGEGEDEEDKEELQRDLRAELIDVEMSELKKGIELVPGLGRALKTKRKKKTLRGGDGEDDDDDFDEEDEEDDGGESFGFGGIFAPEKGGANGRQQQQRRHRISSSNRSLGSRLRGAAGAVGGAAGAVVSAPLRLFSRGRRNGSGSEFIGSGGSAGGGRNEFSYSTPLLGREKAGTPPGPGPVSSLSLEEKVAMGPERLAAALGRERADRNAAADARALAAWRAKQRKLEILRTRSYAQRAADETARMTEEALLGAPPASLSDEEDAAGRAELPQDVFAKKPTPSTVEREPTASSSGRKLDRSSAKARPSGVKPAMAPSVLEREFAGRLSLSLFGRGIFGVPEELEEAEGGRDFFEGTAEARNPLLKFLPRQLRPEPPLVGFGVYARPRSVAKFLGREYVDDHDENGFNNGGDDDSADEMLKPTKETRWSSVHPLQAVQDPLFYADLMRVAPEIGLTVVAWVPRPLPAAALARALGEAAAANAAAASAAAFRDDLVLRRRALASGALPPLPSPADVVDYSEGAGAAAYEDEDDEEDEEGGESYPSHDLGPSWPCLRAGKRAERLARGAAFQLAVAADAAARATAAHEAALAQVAEVRRRRNAARTAIASRGELLSDRFWRRMALGLGIRLGGEANQIGTSEMGSALPRPVLPDSAYVVDRGVFEGALPKDEKEEEKKKKEKEKEMMKKKKSGEEEEDVKASNDPFSFLDTIDEGDIDEDLIVIPEGEPWIDAQGNIRPGSKLIFTAAPGGGLVVEALPPSRGFREDAHAARLNGGAPPPKPKQGPVSQLFSPLVDAWRKFGGIPVDPLEDPSLPQPVTDAAERARLVACCGPGSAGALLGALLGPKPVDKLARVRVGQRAAFELHTPEAEAEAAFNAAVHPSSSNASYDPKHHKLSMTWLASLDARGVRESMPAMVDSIDPVTAPFTLPLLLREEEEEEEERARGKGKKKAPSSTSTTARRRLVSRPPPPTLLRGVSAAAAAFGKRGATAMPLRQQQAAAMASSSSWGGGGGGEEYDEEEEEGFYDDDDDDDDESEKDEQGKEF